MRLDTEQALAEQVLELRKDIAELKAENQNLCRRIHRQRERLKQLEEFKGWHTGEKDRHIKKLWMEESLKRSAKNKELVTENIRLKRKIKQSQSGWPTRGTWR